LFGRILVVLIFLQSGIEKIGDFQGTAKYMASHGIAPYTNFFLVGAVFFELVGVITLVLGYYARFGAFLLLLFLIPTTIIFHGNFAEQSQMVHFMKNVSMFGGLLVLLAVGAGRFSLDYFFRSGKK
jgi:putative oxidoreductase